ncbi:MULTISPECIES: nicotinamide mononucleotide transporter family protein [Deinococcus]|uniref:Nicotinamide mononucleotide transporter family protein n=1 Tax=Deinococcus rufus TaxID=2136097 RepID=A0ABV7Z810_9DEIO|nr:nicotinamide mononucleotide transporter family protein [Deinococcus sp. AB2017081]WQE96416.1 nicotinamide mononucleotide transporter family protein [Deinococcus sp. AB2017081]
MTVFGLDIPPLLLDLTGGLCVLVSLYFLWAKSSVYWHWSNLSLLPYFLLFLSGNQWMLAGLQVTYLLFGIHGLYLWHLERQRDERGVPFREGPWYGVTWAASLAIFASTVAVTDFGSAWNWVQFAAVTLALVANFGTTRRWAWSWPVWIAVNAVQAVYFWHTQYWVLFGLQFVLAAMSVVGWRAWRRDERRDVAFA